MDSLRRLPEGAAYTERSGHATASLSHRGDTIVVNAGCDSLQQMIYNLEEKLEGSSMNDAKQTTQKQPYTATFSIKAKWFAIGTLAGIILTFLIYWIIKIYRLWQMKLK